MVSDMQRGALAVVVGSLLAGCSGGGAATVTERLWISGVPTDPKAEISAFATTKTDQADRYVGVFYRGSIMRGTHDVFEWRNVGKDDAELVLLQDNQRVKLHFTPCKPTTGFDHCVEVRQGTAKPERYYSRKRWVVRRPGRKRGAALGLFEQVLLEVAEEDDELAAVLDASVALVEDPRE